MAQAIPLATSGVDAEFVYVVIPLDCGTAEACLKQAAALIAKPYKQQTGVSVDIVGTGQFYACVRCLLAANQTVDELRADVRSHAFGLRQGAIEDRHE